MQCLTTGLRLCVQAGHCVARDNGTWDIKLTKWSSYKTALAMNWIQNKLNSSWSELLFDKEPQITEALTVSIVSDFYKLRHFYKSSKLLSNFDIKCIVTPFNIVYSLKINVISTVCCALFIYIFHVIDLTECRNFLSITIWKFRQVFRL